jgi:hypothetical protein
MKKRLSAVPFRVPVPFDRALGLGDAVKRVTATLGIRHCSGCVRRAEVLNRILTFAGKDASVSGDAAQPLDVLAKKRSPRGQ